MRHTPSDHAEMERQLAWGTAQSGVKALFEWDESDSAAFSGQLKRAREMSRQALESAVRAGEKEIAAELHLDAALRDSEFGDHAQAQQHINLALGLASTPEVQTLAALALARVGRVSESQKLAKQLAAAYPSNTLLNSYWLPTIRAAIELDRKNSLQAIEILRNAATYELSWFPPLEGNLYSAYLRGEAYLLLHQGNEATSEFQKFRTHPGTAENYAWSALARLGLARAYVLQHDTANARAAYQDFLMLWKDADPNIPMLKEAKSEYAELQ